MAGGVVMNLVISFHPDHKRDVLEYFKPSARGSTPLGITIDLDKRIISREKYAEMEKKLFLLECLEHNVSKDSEIWHDVMEDYKMRYPDEEN